MLSPFFSTFPEKKGKDERPQVPARKSSSPNFGKKEKLAGLVSRASNRNGKSEGKLTPQILYALCLEGKKRKEGRKLKKRAAPCPRRSKEIQAMAEKKRKE